MAQMFNLVESIGSTNSFESINSIETSDSDTSNEENSINNQIINIPNFTKYKKKSIKTKLIFNDNYNVELILYNIINTLKLNNISYTLKKNYKFNCCLSNNEICLLFNIYIWKISDKDNEYILETTHKKGNKKYLINIFNAIVNNSKIIDNNIKSNSILSNPYINNIINDYIKLLNYYLINNTEENIYKLLYTLNELSSKKDYHEYILNNNTHIIILNIIYNNDLLTNNNIICHILALSCILTLSYNKIFINDLKIEISNLKNIKKTNKLYINKVIDNKINEIIKNL